VGGLSAVISTIYSLPLVRGRDLCGACAFGKPLGVFGKVRGRELAGVYLVVGELGAWHNGFILCVWRHERL